MGNDQATLLQKSTNRLNISKYVEISAKHNKKIIHKNLKSFKQFSSNLKSIYLRTKYLKYDWSQWLCSQLTKDQIKIYDEYCQMFKLNIVKNKPSSQYFQIKNFGLKFIESLDNHSKYLQSIKFSLDELEKLFEEVKCYFMVQSWFVDIPLNNYLKNHQATWSSSSKQNQQKQKSTLLKLKSCNSQPQNITNPQKIYRVLMKLTEIYFINNYFVQQPQVPAQCQSPKHNPMKRFSPKQNILIKSISKQSNFKQRQVLIYQLLNSILKFNQKQRPHENSQFTVAQHKKIYALTKILGLKNVYSNLKILIQIGSIQNIQLFQIVFNHIMKRFAIPLQNIQKSKNNKNKNTPNTSKNPESPQKRKSSKIKTELIR